jgi:hypothetical protein
MKEADCVDEFIGFLQGVGSKKANANVNTTFSCRGISVSIVLVGRPETILLSEHGYDPYLSHIRNAVEQGVRVFYLLARGTFNCSIAEKVAYYASKDKLVKETDRYADVIGYRGAGTSVSCIRLESISADAYKPFLDLPNV